MLLEKTDVFKNLGSPSNFERVQIKHVQLTFLNLNQKEPNLYNHNF